MDQRILLDASDQNVRPKVAVVTLPFASFFLFCLFPFLSRFMGNQTDKMMALYRVCIDNFNDTCEKSNKSFALDVCRDISNRTAMNIPHELTFDNRGIFRSYENQTRIVYTLENKRKGPSSEQVYFPF